MLELGLTSCSVLFAVPLTFVSEEWLVKLVENGSSAKSAFSIVNFAPVLRYSVDHRESLCAVGNVYRLLFTLYVIVFEATAVSVSVVHSDGAAFLITFAWFYRR